MKSLFKHLISITILALMLTGTACEKMAAEREIQRFKDAHHDPQIVGKWFSGNHCSDFRSDGQFLDVPTRKNQYYYTGNGTIYILWPGDFLRKNMYCQYEYRVNNDTLHLMNGIWTRTPSTPSNDEN